MSRQTPEETFRENIQEVLWDTNEQLKQLRMSIERANRAMERFIGAWDKQNQGKAIQPLEDDPHGATR